MNRELPEIISDYTYIRSDIAGAYRKPPRGTGVDLTRESKERVFTSLVTDKMDRKSSNMPAGAVGAS